MSKKQDWIVDLDIKEKLKLKKFNRRRTVEDNPRQNSKGIIED